MQEPKDWFQSTLEELRFDPVFLEEGLRLEALECVCKVMRERGISNSQLAAKLDCSPSYVTKLMRGSENLTLRKIAQLASVLECSPKISFQDPSFMPAILQLWKESNTHLSAKINIKKSNKQHDHLEPFAA